LIKRVAVIQGSTSLGASQRRGADLSIVELDRVDQHQAMAELLRRVWGAPSVDALMNPATLRAMSHSGNYVAGAYRDGELVGAAVAFLGIDHLHSHITGVLPGGQGAGVGFALKQHQRDWALRRGIGTVRWTFDPLVRRNAFFNLHKLGARVHEYLPDFYGEMHDGINDGDATDRLYVWWELSSPRAVQAAAGGLPEVDIAAARAGGAAVWLDRVDGEPVRRPYDHAELVLVAVAEDIEQARRHNPALGSRWRLAVRDALSAALGGPYKITMMSRDGWYVLEAA
jgi:predicted GNAT superfamily acetyltransferase